MRLREDWQERIIIDPAICHGKACIKGTRIMVSVILDYLKSGAPVDSVLGEYPGLEEADVRAAIGYAAWLAHEEDELPLRTEPTG